MKNRGKQGIAEIKPWLNDNAQFYRFRRSLEHVYGGEEGGKLVLEHAGREKHPLFKQWLEAALEAGQSPIRPSDTRWYRNLKPQFGRASDG